MGREASRHRTVLSPKQRDHVRRSRETLVGGGLLDIPPGGTGVPRVIERSWRRCAGEEVPVAPQQIPYRALDGVPALRRAAEPVLERLRHSLADVAVALVLSDASGRIIARHVDVRRQRALMDRAHAAEGFDFSESSVGTNGLGTVLVERRPVLVRGPEHYNVDLEDLTCAGTPITEPWTGRLAGSFSLACATRDVHPLMAGLADDVGRQIEARLLDQVGARRRRLVEAHLAVGRSDAGALVVDDETVLANRSGLAHTGPDLHPVLWRHLCECELDGPRQMPIPLSDGFHDALVEPVADAGKPAFSVRLLPRQPDRAPRAAVAGRPAPVRLHHDDEVDRRLAAATGQGELVGLVGPGGCGKLRTARRLLRREGADAPVVVEPAVDPDWFARAREAVTARQGLVVRRVHEPPQPTAGQLEALVGAGCPVVLTADLDVADDATVGLVRRLATTVRLPALVGDRDHLPAAVREALAELPVPESRTTFSPAAWDRLLAWHWPGNFAELHTTLVGLARRAGGGLVEERDLPDELRGAQRAMSLMESAERDAVVDALRAARGNRTWAARALGIGRNTLYRKMREFGIR